MQLVRRTLAVALATALGAAAAAGPGSASAAPRLTEAPLVAAATGLAIPGSYIVVLDRGVDSKAKAEKVRKDGAKVSHVYTKALQGFSAQLGAGQLKALLADPSVAYVEQDSVVTVDATQSGATWGLDRIDQRDMPLDGSYSYATDAPTVHAYVIDTGMRRGHSQFTGRVGAGFDAISTANAGEDCNGHGTHVAGTIGGTTYGVAKKATLHPVRVLDCAGSGTNSGVIAGVDWVRANAVKPAVANMSLGGGASTALDSAVKSAIASGVTFALAAGNENTNACNGSPARVPEGVTVGATTNTDARASYSNYGTCLDLFAPGSSITSSWYTSDTATNTISGTSMATPHVAGVAALILAGSPAATPAQVRDQLVSTGTPGKVTDAQTGSPNVLLYSSPGGATPPPPPPPAATTLTNGGFESGPGVGWAESSSGGYGLVSTSLPRTGIYGAYLGGYNNAVETVSQNVTVPTSGTLRYWWRMSSNERSTTKVYDYLDVQLVNPSTGAVVTTLARYSNAGSTRNAWTQASHSLAAYAGQTLSLRFTARTDSSATSSFYLDDVSL